MRWYNNEHRHSHFTFHRRFQLYMMERKPTVLVVDDDPRILRLVRVNVERAGFNVATATGGAAALEELAAAPPDLAVLDVTMPGIDGYTLTQKIREISN